MNYQSVIIFFQILGYCWADVSRIFPHPDLVTSASQADTQDRESSQQTFYPSFHPFQNPPLGHSRPFFFQQEGAYSQRPHSGFDRQQLSFDSPRFSGYKDNQYRASASEARGLLGSGNFGVIRGGTFYEKDAESDYDRDYSNYFRNGHGRPSSYFGGGGGGGPPNPKPHQHEQFENFRDFADINSPNSAYSEFVVVYVNKNATKKENEVKRPKNIIESLALLDEETPPKKLSKSKAKLAKLLPEKKYKIKKSQKTKTATTREYEPLLALS